MKEEWKKIDYNPIYEVSNIGNVRNTYTGRIIKHTICSTGLPVVCLSCRGKVKSFSIPKLMLMAFKPELLLGNTRKSICYKDGNRCNLSLDNLEVREVQKHTVNKIKTNTYRKLYTNIIKTAESVIARNERMDIDDTIKTLDEIYNIVKSIYSTKNTRMK